MNMRQCDVPDGYQNMILGVSTVLDLYCNKPGSHVGESSVLL